MSKELNVSESVLASFDVFDFSLDKVSYPEIYNRIVKILPRRNSAFDRLSEENVVACEVICAAICHQINWDFLRRVVYEKTLEDSKWILPLNLAKITSKEMEILLKDYDKPERIRAKERAQLLRTLGKGLFDRGINYRDIFFEGNDERTFKDIEAILNSSKAFSKDPESKKTQLLMQNLSTYSGYSFLNKYCKPAIDYHIIREFLRRGIVCPSNQTAIEFIKNPKTRKEQTVAGLRKVCAEAFFSLKWLTEYDIVTLNTVEWWIGRSVCVKENPDCQLLTDDSQWLKPEFLRCPFYESCYARQVDNEYLTIVEPNYQGNSY